YLYQTGFYDEAFNRYKNLLTLDPGNSNILFRCGACCLNIPGSEQQAVTYLGEAAPGVSLTYKDRSHKEPGAPVLTYFMLGRAHHLNNEFDKAIENYTLFIETGVEEDPLQLEYAEMQILACERANKVTRNPPSFEFQDVLDHFDDDLPSCNNPVISGDGNTLIFLVDYPADKKIMMTTREGKLWTRPRVINSEIGMVGETFPVCLSYDGNDLYLVHQYYSHSDLFVSRFEGRRWSEVEALNHNINGRTSETHASISKDENTLYFTSDRRGGSGSFDIYVTRKDASGDWGQASNLGPVINTPYEEHTPFISSTDSILFFSSQGHASIGGIDVYYSEMNPDGSWGEPKNLGYPVNTTGEDLFFNPGWDELDGYYAVRRESDPTSNTINMVIELEPEPIVAKVPVEEPMEEPVAEAPVEEPAEEPVTEAPEEPVEQPKLEPVTETVDPVQSDVMVKIIEPPVTDEILEVLNRNAEEVEPTPPVKPVARPTSLETSIPFEHNEFELNMPAMLEVEKIADLMQDYSGTRVELTGHADATGASEYNMLLSLQRANQIASYLEMRGVLKDRITISGKGEGAPIARNQYPDGDDAPLGRFLNRHVSVRISGSTPLDAELSGLYIPSSLKPDPSDAGDSGDNMYWFTIQLMAQLKPAKIEHFQGFDNVKEYVGQDDYYRYTCGAFKNFEEARTHLKKVHKMGFEDAFIQTLEWYQKATQ
ncbi:MAG: OmpA family protein, partial [Bacteroidales bacterium]|nr:OmpA family protein [Bacteroidales bacterium]